MKTPVDVVQHETNFTGEDIAMGIDPDPSVVAHIMSVLTKIYSDPVKAVIREVISNAKDSHVAAGVDTDIEIAVPTPLNRNFVVQDHGVGLDLDDLKNIFSQYGTSTKRDTNDAIGTFGIGAKSPLAYTSQFTLECIKNGVRILALVTRESAGGGGIQIVDTSSTTAGNGVKVTVPVHTSILEFTNKTIDFLRWWDSGYTCNVDVPERECTLAFDNIEVYRRTYANNVYVVMGGVAYPANVNSPAECAIFVPIGAVDITPAREEIMYTTKTKEYLAKYDLHAMISAEASKRIDSEPNHVSARQTAARWKNNLGLSGLTYRGADIPWSFDAPAAIYSCERNEANYVRVHIPRQKSTIVYNFTKSRLTTKDRAVLKKVFPMTTVYVYNENPVEPWFTDIELDAVVDWNTIKNAEVALTPTKKSKHLKFTTWGKYGGVQSATIDTDTPYYVIVGGTGDTKQYIRGYAETVYRIPPGRLNAFLKRYPKAIKFENALDLEVDKFFKKHGLVKLAYARISTQMSFDYADLAKLHDPTLRAILTQESITMPAHWHKSPHNIEVEELATKLREELTNKYPLLFLATFYGWGYKQLVRQELITYANRIYKETK